MKTGILLLVLLCLPALSLAVTCSAGATLTSGCRDCNDAAADSDCNWCDHGFYKTAAKACTACPAGTGRSRSSTTTQIETAAVCSFDWAPQLKCASASGQYVCATCAAGAYRESGRQFDYVSVTGCSTDCKSFVGSGASTPLVPQTESPAAVNPSCVSCSSTSSCFKCVFAETTMKQNSFDTPGTNKQLTKCTECQYGYYLVPNTADPTIVPTCSQCGANCKKCKDNTECTECWAGWALDGVKKGSCQKQVAASTSIFQVTMISILALFIGW